LFDQDAQPGEHFTITKLTNSGLMMERH
jgi:hypothetical protein